MKTKLLLLAALVASLSLCFASCSDDEDGDWDAMKWKTEVPVSRDANGDYVVQVPEEGGTMVFTCTNYGILYLEVRVDKKKLGEGLEFSEEWGSIKVDQKGLNVTIKPEAKEKHQEIVVYDTASNFTFKLK